MRREHDGVIATRQELREALAAVLRGTNLVPFDEADEWADLLSQRLVRRLNEPKVILASHLANSQPDAVR